MFRNGRTFKNLGDSIRKEETKLTVFHIAPHAREITAHPKNAARIIHLIATIIGQILGAPLAIIRANASLVDDLGADSLAVHKILFALREKFECDGPIEDSDEFKFVKDVINYVEAKCSKR